MTTPIAQSVDTLAGRTSTAPFITIIETRAPTPLDGVNNALKVGQRWVDSSAGNKEYFLLNFVSFAGSVTANWVLLASGSATTETLTGNTGLAVTVDGANNINVVGDITTGITFNGASHTLTASLVNIPNASLQNDDITLIAGTGISITTSPVALGGSTTISATSVGDVQTLTGNSGGAVSPTTGNINVVGDGITIDIIGNPGTSTLTASTTDDVPTSFVTDSGTAIPASHSISILGSGSVATSALGNVITINGSMPVSDFTLIQSQVISSPTAAIEFTTGISNAFTTYIMTLENVVLSTTNHSIALQVSINGGASYLSTGYSFNGLNLAAATPFTGTNALGGIPGLDNTAGIGASGQFWITGVSGANYKMSNWSLTGVNSGGLRSVIGNGWQTTSSPVNAFQIIDGNIGNIASGTVNLYGIT